MNVPNTSPTYLIARNVRAEMARRGRKQSSLAVALGLSTASISDRLTGKVPIDVNELHAIALFLGVPLAELLHGVEAPTAVPA